MTMPCEPSAIAFATAASIADVPVLADVAIVNALLSARNTRCKDARTSSSIGTKSGSRWLSTGAAIARMTRGVMRLGPGPSRMRSVDGSGMVSWSAGHGRPMSVNERRAARLAEISKHTECIQLTTDHVHD